MNPMEQGMGISASTIFGNVAIFFIGVGFYYIMQTWFFPKGQVTDLIFLIAQLTWAFILFVCTFMNFNMFTWIMNLQNPGTPTM